MGDIARPRGAAQAMSLKRVASKFTYAALAWRELCTLAEHRVIVNGKRASALETGMDDWDNFYMLAGGTAGTLIGLIFVVITLGMDHAQEGDDVAYPPLRHAHSRLFHQPARHLDGDGAADAALARAVSLGVIGCAGLAYVLHVAQLSRTKLTEGLVWTCCCRLRPMRPDHHRRGLGARSAVRQRINAIAVVILLITALRNSWMSRLHRQPR